MRLTTHMSSTNPTLTIWSHASAQRRCSTIRRHRPRVAAHWLAVPGLIPIADRGVNETRAVRRHCRTAPRQAEACRTHALAASCWPSDTTAATEVTVVSIELLAPLRDRQHHRPCAMATRTPPFLGYRHTAVARIATHPIRRVSRNCPAPYGAPASLIARSAQKHDALPRAAGDGGGWLRLRHQSSWRRP